jgi:putative membrane protein
MNQSTEKSRPPAPGIAERIDLNDADRVSVEQSARRTGMSFQRTRMSADRTLMSIMRTALSLIAFGFTLYQAFSRLRDSKIIAETSHAPQNFGTALVAVGVLMLTLGIAYHIRFMLGLRGERNAMIAQGLIHGQSEYPPSLTLLTALLLLAIGLLAIASMVFNIPLFG